MAMHDITEYTQKLADTFTKQSNIATVESTSTASKAYAVDEFLIYGGQFYKVTTAIAQGDTIVTSGSGQNVEVTTVDEEFEERDAEVAAITNVYGSKNVYDPSSLRRDVANGLTFSVSDKGALNIRGTCTASGSLRLTNAWSIPIDIPEFVGQYITIYDDTATLAYNIYLADDNHLLQISSTKKQGVLLNFNPTYLYIASAFVADTAYNTTIYPMLRDAAIKDTSFEPYAKTNSQLTEDAAQLPAMQEAGAVNLFHCTAVSNVSSGVTWTVDDDSVITANGTATANSALNTTTVGDEFSFPFDVIVSGLPMNDPGSTKYFWSIGETYYYTDKVRIPANTSFRIVLWVMNGYTANNLKFKIMIYDARLVNPPYQPFTMTNRELTDAVSDTGWKTAAINTDKVDSGTINYRVKAGVCFVTIWNLKMKAVGNNQAFTTELPHPQTAHCDAYLGNEIDTVQACAYLNTNSSLINTSVTTGLYGSFSYPVA